MKTIIAVACATLAVVTASPAAAALIEYQYAGTVAAVFGPAPDGVIAGDIARVRIRFDTSALVDITAAANTAFGPFPPGTDYTDLEAASLSLIEVSLGPNAWVMANQFDLFGNPIAAVSTPYVLFNNGGFFGVSFFGINPSASAFATSGATREPFDFVGGNFGAPGVSGPSYGGFFNYAGALSHVVPEPSSWTLMIAGIGLAGASLRRRRNILAKAT